MDRDAVLPERCSVDSGVVPVWSKGAAPYCRQEDDGFLLVIPPRLPRPHFLNKTAAFILNRCDGKHDLWSIVHELAVLYREIPVRRIYDDTLDCLHFLRTLGLIDWREEAERENERMDTEGITYRIAGERDFKPLGRFLERVMHAEYLPGQTRVLVFPEQHLLSAYHDISIRTRQFHGTEVFFVASSGSIVLGAVSLIRVVSTDSVMLLGILAAENDDEALMKGLFTFVREAVKSEGVRRIKVRLHSRIATSRVMGFLETLGFSLEAVLKDEGCDGIDLPVWSTLL